MDRKAMANGMSVAWGFYSLVKAPNTRDPVKGVRSRKTLEQICNA